MSSLQRLVWAAGLSFSMAAVSLAEEPAVAAEAPLFERDVRPLLKIHCFQCHGEEAKPKGGLDVRLRRLIVTGGESGTAIVPGQPDESELFARVSSGEMPPGDKKLSAAEQDIIRRWIAAGALTARPEPEKVEELPLFTEEERNFWAFQPLTQPTVPTPPPEARARTPIDAFLADRLQREGLAFSPEADRITLLRRATFDLTGLPPTPEQTVEFLNDSADDAYERLIDRLLASPRYGERWGRHWLDVAGYADSEGYTADDAIRPEAYKYRDYVIRAFNADKPLDQFIVEQLAGDEVVPLPHKNLSPEAIETLTATGFLRMAADGTASGGIDQEVARNQVLADTIQIVTSSLLGMTVACAQCHDHRYDPIPQVDYYAIRAIFEPAYNWREWKVPMARRLSLATDADHARSAEIELQAKAIDEERLKKQEAYILATFEKELAKLPEEVREPIRTARNTPEAEKTAEQKELLKSYPSVNVTAGSLYLYDRAASEELKKEVERATAIRATKPVEEFLRVLTEPVDQPPPITNFLARGDLYQPKQQVFPAGLSVLASHVPPAIPEKAADLPTTGRRLAFARSLTSGKHPLTPRVLANRLWMHHFGRGLVNTPSDFGLLGERPSHPELLDWLAGELVSGGWRIKRLHKLIMTSTAYRQSSLRSQAVELHDPDNRFLARMPIRRLEAEAVRDTLLAASGKLNLKMFGPPVPVMEDEVGQIIVGIENLNGENRPDKTIPLNGEEFRRSVYVQVRRSRPLGVLETFDIPTMEPNCDARSSSTVAPQSLMLMNSLFVTELSQTIAERVHQEVGADVSAQAARAWQLAYTAPPTEQELAGAVAFLTTQTELFQAAAATPPPAGVTPKPPALQALAVFCQALVSSNRFLYVD